MSNLKVAILAGVAALLLIAAMMSVVMSIIYAAIDSPWYSLYALIAVLSAMGGRYLFWVTGYKR